nr:putative RecD/TraA family helicase [Oceanusvirus sp.]
MDTVTGVICKVSRGRSDTHRKVTLLGQPRPLTIYGDHPSSSDIDSLKNNVAGVTFKVDGIIIRDFFSDADATRSLRAFLHDNGALANGRAINNRARIQKLYDLLKGEKTPPHERLAKYPFMALRVEKDMRLYNIRTAQIIARNLGLPNEVICRGLCEYHIQDLVQDEGHVCYPSEIYQNIIIAAGYPADTVKSQINRLVETKRLFFRNGMYYPQQTFSKEQRIRTFLAKCVENDPEADTEDDDGDDAEADADLDASLDPDQIKAVKMALRQRVTVLVGPAGSGKTRVVAEIKRWLGNSAMMAAPTGKAARRMTQACGDGEAYTLHRLLGIECTACIQEQSAIECKRDDKPPVLIIDEASMIDLRMMDLVVASATHYGMRLVIVGDDFQLPSVSYGQVLGDLIDWAKANGKLAALSRIHRQGQDSPVIDLATAVRLKQKLTDAHIDNDKVTFFAASTSEDVRTRVMKIRQEHSNEIPFEFQVISPLNAAVDDINREVLKTVRGDDFLGAFRSGDVVVCTKNQGKPDENKMKSYRPGINGDVGIVDDPSAGIITSDGGESVSVGKNMRHAHAMTVHKSQGSEWGTVVVVLGNGFRDTIINRKLIYTAITRTRNRLYIIGSRRMLQQFVDNDPPFRHTGGFDTEEKN